MFRWFGFLVLLQSFQAFAVPLQSEPEIEKFFSEFRKKALQKSYDVQVSQASFDQKAAQYYSASTNWVPHLNLQLAQTRSKDFSFITGGSLGALASQLIPQVNDLRRWDLELTLPLYKRSVQLGVSQSYYEKKLAENDLALKRSELDWRLRALLGDYLLQVYKEVTLQNSISIAKTNLREAELRFQLGQRTKIDLLRAKANLLSLESKNFSYQAAKQSALDALLEYSGLDRQEFELPEFKNLVSNEDTLVKTLDRFSNADSSINQIKPFLNAENPALEKKIVDSSPVYRQYLAEQDFAQSRTQSLMAEEWPELLLKGSLNKQGSTWSDSFASGNRSYSIALVLNIPLFSGGSIVSRYNEKSYSATANDLKTEKDLRHFKNEVENERVQIRSLLSALEAEKLSLSQNEEIVRLSFKSYQLGKATMLELLSSQNDLIDSKTNLAKTKTDLAVLVRKFAWNLGVSAL